MGNVISLEERRRTLATGSPARHPRPRAARATFSFDLALPQTYLAAERVDQLFAGVRWQPASARIVWNGNVPVERLAAEAEDRAAALGAPLIWPDTFAAEVRPAMRAAALACELGRGAAFVLAASRLAYCGGFDLGDPEVLAEAAAAAGVPLEDCLAAAGDTARDQAIEDAGRRLVEMGARELPTLRVGRQLFAGEARLPEAAAAATAFG
ncbi:MAG: DsbA family protein [Solirubrobacteraceae bacterium]